MSEYTPLLVNEIFYIYLHGTDDMIETLENSDYDRKLISELYFLLTIGVNL